MVRSSQKRESEQAMCVHTACFKGIPKAQRTAKKPGERSSLGLFIPENQSGEPVVFIRSQQVCDPSIPWSLISTLEKHLHTVHLSSIVLARGTRRARTIT